MEGRFVVTALFFTVLAACSKQEIPVNPTQGTFVTQQVEAQSELFITEWESIPSWKSETKNKATVFSYARQVPGLNDKVTVLVFARNLWTGDDANKELENRSDKPLMMPFYFLPYFEKPNYTEEWTYAVGENKINISLVLQETQPVAQPPGKKIQLQFFVIPRQVLSEKKLTTESVRKLPYDRLIKTFSSSAS